MKIALKRLAIEWCEWKRNPLPNFIIELATTPQGKKDYFKWYCWLPGRKSGLWGGIRYKLIITFDNDYPAIPPNCFFEHPLFHPNIYPSGTVCLSILNVDEDWMPSYTVKQLLLGIQDLLDNPNIVSPAQIEPYTTYKNDYNLYVEKVKERIELIKKAAAEKNELDKTIIEDETVVVNQIEKKSEQNSDDENETCEPQSKKIKLAPSEPSQTENDVSDDLELQEVVP